MGALSDNFGAWHCRFGPVTTRRLHRLNALVLGVFLALHLSNHLAGLAGQESHQTVQETFRLIYRNPVVESLLIAFLAAQIGLGLALAWGRKRLTLQSVAGLYLAFFLSIHLGAVFAARWQGIPTDLAFAAAGMHAPLPWPVIFALYYGLAIIALGVHLSAALARRRPYAAKIVMAGGIVIAGLIVSLLAGWITPLTIPAALIEQFPALGT
jgi:succinate dehydrogenase/fumarate reductase cytochrome b subunit